jgi:hypothetical protein
MKLKLVVASMSVLGLISGAAFADTTTTTTKHKHHKKMHQAHVAQSHDYKAMGGLAVQPTAVSMETSPAVDQYSAIYDSMSQNANRGKAMPDWFNRVGVSGGVNFDAHWGNRDLRYVGENVTRLSLNDGYLNATANVNDWTKAFVGLSYNSASGLYNVGYTSNNITNFGQSSDKLNLEQAYVTLANYDVSPLFLQVGKQYTDFGRYTIHPITRTMTQVLSESLATSAKLGFITKMGLHGQVYAFDNNLVRSTQGHTKSVYGAALGFSQPNDQLGYDVGVGYMSNMLGVNDIATIVNFNRVTTGLGSTFVHNVGAVAVYADVNSGPFNISGRYTTSIQRFNPTDLSTQGGKLGANAMAESGARPWAADLTAGYGYNAMGKNQNVYVGYQTSNNAVNLLLPKNRWLVGFGVDMWKNTNLGLEVAHDTAYSSGNGGTGSSNNTIGARASVKFG